MVGHVRGQGGRAARFAGAAARKAGRRSRTVAHRFIAEGDYVIVEARGDNVTKAGQRYDNEYCFVFRLSDGKISEVKEYSDTALIDAVLGDPLEAVMAG
jgi:ketosteroid isomerase-like protein